MKGTYIKVLNDYVFTELEKIKERADIGGGLRYVRRKSVDLRMEKILSADGIFDDSTRQCRVRKYDPEEDFIYLELKEDKLEAISLDAKYRCYISTRTELLYCTGVVKERYCQEDKKLLKFRIEKRLL